MALTGRTDLKPFADLVAGTLEKIVNEAAR
jgi:hypothetical protein